MKAIPEIIKIASRKLRKNMTESEILLWKELKARKLHWVKFQRQTPTYLFTENTWFDRYIIPDFYCSEYKLIIELDWNVHDVEEIYILDREKEKILKSLWYKILRFRNEEIYEDIESVLNKIKENFY